jgi:glycyl-tRNA synthetase beta chain
MKSDFLFELGTEELPPKILRSLSDKFTQSLCDGLLKLELRHGAVQAFATPRRLAVLIRELDHQTSDKDVVIWGPPARVAFTDDGKPTKAAEAFASKNNLPLNKLQHYIDSDGQQDKLCLRRTEPGIQTAQLLTGLINQALAALPMPKRMRWGSGREEFSRPVQWVMLLFADYVFNDKILSLTPSNVTRGHRFHCPEEIVVEAPGTYQQQLQDAFVVADFSQRKTLILQGIEKLTKNIDGTAVIDEDLLDEVAALNEWPVPLMGKFDPHFLAVPQEALISSMKEHQKYFHLVDKDNNLLPAFITVANLESQDPQQVVNGNERVIRPRLADAAFFYENDKLQTLNSRRPLLKEIVFQAQLGSMYDKTNRVAAVAAGFAPIINADPTLVRRAAELSKSDLVTDMVGEFDTLQGSMGRDYALHDGEEPEVAEALFEQYLPRFAGDMIPTTSTGMAVALADKLDSLVGIFSIGQQPSGSKDPFALRRASLGVLRILIEGNIDIDLLYLIQQTRAQFQDIEACKHSAEELDKLVLTYILDRLKSWYRDKNLSVEVYNSVACLGLSNPLDINARVAAVDKFTLLPEASDLAAANKRVSNLLSKQSNIEQPDHVDDTLLENDAEKQLAAQIVSLTESISPLLEQRDYYAVLEQLATLRNSVDQFFEDVMVMTDDLKVQSNRLALLYKLQQLFMHVADISQLVPAK